MAGVTLLMWHARTAAAATPTPSRRPSRMFHTSAGRGFATARTADPAKSRAISGLARRRNQGINTVDSHSFLGSPLLMQIESLKVFCDLAETESFTKAAQINHIPNLP